MKEIRDGMPRRIINLMRIKKINQGELAKMSKTTEATISQILSKKRNPGLYIIVRIARALNTDLNYLCGFDNRSLGATKNQMALGKIAEVMAEVTID